MIWNKNKKKGDYVGKKLDICLNYVKEVIEENKELKKRIVLLEQQLRYQYDEPFKFSEIDFGDINE